MSTLDVQQVHPEVDYPDSDDEPMAENTLQYQWIVTIVGGLRHLLAENPNVFVAGDLFWYPIKGDRDTRLAPDVMVAIGRPKGHRGSYRQWEEAGIAPQVVFEVLSPGNRKAAMSEKFKFYERHGVEEYYVYDPDRLRLKGFLRHGERLVEIKPMNGHISPRLAIKFEMGADGLTIRRPDGKPFVTFEEIAEQEEQERRRAEQAAERAEQAEDRAKRAEEREEQLERELQRLRSAAAEGS